MATDSNGFEVKPAHTGEEDGVSEDSVYVYESCSGSVYGYWESLEDAAWAFNENVINGNMYRAEWFTLHQIDGDTVRTDDFRLEWMS